MIGKLLFLQEGTGNRGKYLSLLSSLLLRYNSKRLPKNVMRETGRCIVVESLNFTENSCYLQMSLRSSDSSDKYQLLSVKFSDDLRRYIALFRLSRSLVITVSYNEEVYMKLCLNIFLDISPFPLLYIQRVFRFFLLSCPSVNIHVEQ